MKYTPHLIIYAAVKKYLTEQQVEELKNDLGKSNLKQDRRFITTIKKYFDMEQLRSKPQIPEEIWIFNYIRFETKLNFIRNGLIAKYEKEIFLPMEISFKELLSMFKKYPYGRTFNTANNFFRLDWFQHHLYFLFQRLSNKVNSKQKKFLEQSIHI